jgi:hypothetical protein
LVRKGDEARVKELLAAIETMAASPSEDIRNVVDVSFVEDAYLDDSERSALLEVRPHLGPATAESLARMEAYFRDHQG